MYSPSEAPGIPFFPGWEKLSVGIRLTEPLSSCVMELLRAQGETQVVWVRVACCQVTAELQAMCVLGR